MSHPHQVLHHPIREELLVPDLGTDRVHRLLKDDKGLWTLRGEVTIKPGGGPRHIVVHGMSFCFASASDMVSTFVPNTEDVLYVVAELTNEIILYTLPPISSAAGPSYLTTVSLLSTPPGPSALGAEILISPSTPHIVASNRYSGHPLGDSISIFTPHPNFELVGEVRTGLNSVRGMQFSADGKWLVAGGAKGGGVKVYEWIGNADGGWAKEVAWVDVEAPTDFLWI